jgi:hypothetical protein
VGSLESRAAARSLLENREDRTLSDVEVLEEYLATPKEKREASWRKDAEEWLADYCATPEEEREARRRSDDTGRWLERVFQGQDVLISCQAVRTGGASAP